MKTKLILAILSFAVIVGCSNSGNEEATTAWVKSAKKPILCRLVGHGENGNVYTLIDADANIHATGTVWMDFPDTIKVAK